MIIRAKTQDLYQARPLTKKRAENTALNLLEMREGRSVLRSKPQRLVLELTNMCNLNCVMCGRNAAEITPVFFQVEWLERFHGIFDSIEEVTLMGWGEPTIHPRFPEMLKITYDAGLRKYFCTNGMLLDELEEDIFRCEADLIAVSMDGADAQTNAGIRRGVDFDKVVSALRSIAARKKKEGLCYPHMNFVFTAMRSNIAQLAAVVELAADIGLNEVKVVFLTVFSPPLLGESLYNEEALVERHFNEAIAIAEERNLLLKLPHVRHTDPAGDKAHKDCYAAHRDLFIGADGYVRACMSSPEKLFHIDQYGRFEDLWNCAAYRKWRSCVNTPPSSPTGCRKCYQSSYANWNKEYAYNQVGELFAPEWG